MRIAVAGINHETNTFSPHVTGLDTFIIKRGEEVVEGELWDNFRRQGVEWLPAMTAVAPPQGLVTREAYQSIKAEILERLARSLPVDGIYLDLHGAMEVAELGDAESDLAQAVRDLAGPEIPIAGSLDLHGNIAPALVEAADVLTAFRTAPHLDVEETRRRAIELLLRGIRDRLKPASVIIKPPLLLPGEFAVTEVEPAKTLYGMVAEIAAMPGMLDASLLIGCAWTDSPFTSVSVIVVAENDRELARREAGRLAAAVWRERERFGPDTETASPDEAVAKALGATARPVVISDSGDNITAGAAGDNPLFVEKLLAADAPDALIAGLIDAEAVARCATAGLGAQLTLSIGGKLDRINGKPLEVTGTVRHLDPAAEPTLAVLRVEGVDIILTSDWYPFWSLNNFKRAGIDPSTRAIVVVKMGYVIGGLREASARSIMALSPGFSDLRMEKLPFKRLSRPIFPLDRDFTWRP